MEKQDRMELFLVRTDGLQSWPLLLMESGFSVPNCLDLIDSPLSLSLDPVAHTGECLANCL